MRNIGKLTFGVAAGIAIALGISDSTRNKAIEVISDLSVTALSVVDAIRDRFHSALEEGMIAAKAKEEELEHLFSEDDGNI